MTRSLALLSAVLLVAAVWLWGSKNSIEGERDAAITARDTVAAALAAERTARANERTAASRMAQIGDKHEADRRDAESVPAAVADAVRTGDLRLREQWAGCETSRLADATAAAVELDALAQLREQDAGRLVQIGRDADDQIRGLQAVIRADREDADGG